MKVCMCEYLIKCPARNYNIESHEFPKIQFNFIVFL